MSALVDSPTGIAPLVIVAALTIPCLGSFIQTTNDRNSKQDGHDSLAKHLASAAAVLGLASELMSGSNIASVSRMPIASAFVWLWVRLLYYSASRECNMLISYSQVLLAVQALAISVEPGVTKRFKNGIFCAASSVIVLLSMTSAAVQMQLSISDVPWPQMFAAFLQAVACLSLPQRPQAAVDGEEFAEEHAASIISLMCFSWVSFLPGLKTVDDLPKVPIGRRIRTLRGHFHSEAGQGALWKKLVRTNRWRLLFQGLLVFLKSLSQFGTRFALHQLLVRLEGTTGTTLEKWLCVAGLGAGLAADGITSGWLIWFTQMLMSSTTTNLLKSLLFEKSTRLQLQHEAAQTSDGRASDKSESRLSLVDLMDNDT